MDTGIEDDQASIDVLDGCPEVVEVFGKGKGTIAAGPLLGDALLDEGKDLDAGEIGTERGEETELGGHIGCGGDDDHATLTSGGTIGHGSAGGERSGDLEGEECFAAAVIAVEEREACEGNALAPEPTDGLGRGERGEVALVGGEGDGELVGVGFPAFEKGGDFGGGHA